MTNSWQPLHPPRHAERCSQLVLFLCVVAMGFVAFCGSCPPAMQLKALHLFLQGLVKYSHPKDMDRAAWQHDNHNSKVPTMGSHGSMKPLSLTPVRFHGLKFLKEWHCQILTTDCFLHTFIVSSSTATWHYQYDICRFVSSGLTKAPPEPLQTSCNCSYRTEVGKFQKLICLIPQTTC